MEIVLKTLSILCALIHGAIGIFVLSALPMMYAFAHDGPTTGSDETYIRLVFLGLIIYCILAVISLFLLPIRMYWMKLTGLKSLVFGNISLIATSTYFLLLYLVAPFVLDTKRGDSDEYLEKIRNKEWDLSIFYD